MAKRAKAKRKSAPVRPTRSASRGATKRRPAASDFDVLVQVGKGMVSVLFRPTNSHYLFRIVENAKAKPRAGAKPTPDVELHTGTPGASDRYVESEIADMSLQLASAAVRDVLV